MSKVIAVWGMNLRLARLLILLSDFQINIKLYLLVVTTLNLF